MKHEHKKKISSAVPYILAGIVIVALIVFVATRKNNLINEVSKTASDTAASATAVPTVPAKPVSVPAHATSQSASGTVSVPSGSPQVLSMVTQITASADADPKQVKHGTFSVYFNVVAKDKDLYISPTCQSENTPSTTDGITFAVYQDGIYMSQDNLGKGSCVVLNHGLSTQTASGRYLVKAGTQNSFELIVVDHPLQSGNYRVALTKAGYSLSDSAGTALLDVSDYDKGRMKTSDLSL